MRRLTVPSELLPDPGVELVERVVGQLRERYQGRRLYVEALEFFDHQHLNYVREFRILMRGPASPTYAPALPPCAPWWVECTVSLQVLMLQPGKVIDFLIDEVLAEARQRGWDLPVFRIGRGAKRLTK